MLNIFLRNGEKSYLYNATCVSADKLVHLQDMKIEEGVVYANI